ncbi:SLAP domain-containing protein [Clostridium sp. 'White wine YQ']|uniref:SLAP domain-containing protein n=1 Tax=Clostridium sp. 'White wine YQ' TaxID=3027474 RepID=UPI0023663B17|nr:SLAP domain-containing protein [Clostridium sp. 'White wine YQ']MDD7794378.1 SLAP domain-containing protein [Clostridium sp. 'White wine YQ']
MKKGIMLILMIGAIMISMVGCSSAKTNATKTDTKEAATNVDSPKETKDGVKTDATQDVNTDTKAPETPATSTEQKPNTQANPKSSAPKAASQFVNGAMVTAVDNVQISPKNVYYKDSKLYMDAYVYNGFSHNIFDVRNINIKLSNNSGVIAQAKFDGMGNTNIGANSPVIWTFVFENDAIKMQNADLGTLNTVYSCDYSF